MSSTITEKDILFVLMNETRKKTLRYLQDKADYASTREISEVTGINMGKVGFHCSQLEERKMVNKIISSGKAMWKITEKGLEVRQEVDKRKRKKNVRG